MTKTTRHYWVKSLCDGRHRNVVVHCSGLQVTTLGPLGSFRRRDVEDMARDLERVAPTADTDEARRLLMAHGVPQLYRNRLMHRAGF